MSLVALISCKIENCLQSDLLEGRVQQPNTIYLLFSVETCNENPRAPQIIYLCKKNRPFIMRSSTNRADYSMHAHT
jgi:hypothetical protein